MRRVASALGLGGAAAALVGVSVIILLASSHTSELVSLGYGGKSLLTGMYQQDVKVGEGIIRAMGSRVNSPVWKELTASKRMEKQLAAALGAQARGGGGGSMDLKGLLGEDGGEGGDVGVSRATGLRGRAADKGSERSAWRSTTLAKAARSLPRSRSASRMMHMEHRKRQQQLEEQSRYPDLVYNAFASGVLDGQPQAHHHHHQQQSGASHLEASLSTASATSHKMRHQEFVDGLKKATGFEDNYKKAPPVLSGEAGSSQGSTSSSSVRLKKLEAEVQTLMSKESGKGSLGKVDSVEGAERKKAIEIVEDLIHADDEKTKGKVGKKVVKKEMASTTVMEAKAKLKAFLGKLSSSEAKGADAEVLKLLKSTEMLDKGSKVAAAATAIPAAAPESKEERDREVREEKERKKEAKEAKELQESIETETAMVYGGRMPSLAPDESSAGSSRAAARGKPQGEGASHVEAKKQSGGSGTRGSSRSSVEVQGGSSADTAAGQHLSRNRAGGDFLIHHKGARDKQLHDLEFKDDVVKMSSLAHLPAISYGNAFEHRSVEGGGREEEGAGAVRRGERDAVRALGFSTSQQYERHKMEGALEKEREEVRELRRERDDARGGLRRTYGEGGEGREEGRRWGRGREEGRKYELMHKVERDLGEVEDFIADRRRSEEGGEGVEGAREGEEGGRGGIASSHRGVQVRSRGLGWNGYRPRSKDEGSWRKFLRPLREDTRHLGDRDVGVPSWKHVNLDMI